MKVKVSRVKSIPDQKTTRGAYEKFWADMKQTPKGEHLVLTTQPKNQKLIANYLYYRARKARKGLTISFRTEAAYCSWK